MRASIVIASHNEGDMLWKTVAACRTTCQALDYEIVVADDASTDQSVVDLVQRFPDVSVISQNARKGVSPTKDLAAEHARGEVLVFLDAHCKPEPGAMEQLVADVEATGGQAVFAPTIVRLDPEIWENDAKYAGHRYGINLRELTWGWIEEDSMRKQGEFWESPSVMGCCLAVSRSVYQELWGFDREMYMWGVEDTDFGLKSWLMGHPVLHDPRAVVGHRFQQVFNAYEVPRGYFVANQLRMARKTFVDSLWHDWLGEFREKQPMLEWKQAWEIFCARRGSIEVERAYLLRHRRHDEFWYADRFGLDWPVPG
ncbi:MAG: glycosyltransferase [Pirellulales bacterium]